MVLTKYLQRIGYAGPLKPDQETLFSLHRAHVANIPYENLSIHLNESISIEPEAIFQKLVVNRRGGYCFEMNGLFYAVLQEIGFDVSLLQGRVWYMQERERDNPMARSHMVLAIQLAGETWIADVGFGGAGIYEPLPFVMDNIQTQFGTPYRLLADDTFGTMMQCEHPILGWMDMYSFEQQPHFPTDYVHTNYFLSHSPESFFVQNKVVTIAKPEGRYILHNMNFKTPTSEKTVASEQEYQAILEQYFGVHLREVVPCT